MKLTQKHKIKCIMFIPSMGNGGAERVMATIANSLSEREYDITIVTLTLSTSFYKLNDSVKIINLGNTINRNNKLKEFITLFRSAINSFFSLNKIIKQKRPDVILSFLTHTNIFVLLSRPFNRKVPIIISERAEPNERNILYKILTKFLYPTADSLVCQSVKVSEFFPRYSQKKIRVIPNPINEESIPKNIPTQKRKSIVGVGRLFPQKNFNLLIDSFQMIQHKYPEHILEIYGEGYLRQELENKIFEMGLQEKVFLRGIKKNVMQHISDAELFVMSSDFEGFPNALVEAMATGLPVISTDFSTGVAKEIIKSENGLIVPVGDKKRLALAITEILSNPEKQLEMQKENRKILSQLNQEVIVQEWHSLFIEHISKYKTIMRDNIS